VGNALGQPRRSLEHYPSRADELVERDATEVPLDQRLGLTVTMRSSSEPGFVLHTSARGWRRTIQNRRRGFLLTSNRTTTPSAGTSSRSTERHVAHRTYWGSM
jgi:hypothetical protein